MEVGAVGGAIGGAAMGNIGGAAGSVATAGAAPAASSQVSGAQMTGAVGATNAAAGASPAGQAASLAGAASPQMQALMELMEGFSSAEILIALMLMKASGGEKRAHNNGDAAMALLVGMAVAGQMSQSAGGAASMSIPGMDGGGMAGGVGVQINFQA